MPSQKPVKVKRNIDLATKNSELCNFQADITNIQNMLKDSDNARRNNDNNMAKMIQSLEQNLFEKMVREIKNMEKRILSQMDGALNKIIENQKVDQNKVGDNLKVLVKSECEKVSEDIKCLFSNSININRWVDNNKAICAKAPSQQNLSITSDSSCSNSTTLSTQLMAKEIEDTLLLSETCPPKNSKRKRAHKSPTDRANKSIEENGAKFAAIQNKIKELEKSGISRPLANIMYNQGTDRESTGGWVKGGMTYKESQHGE